MGERAAGAGKEGCLMNATIRTALAILCVLVIAVCAILIIQRVSARTAVDLTEDKLYTLSDGTRNVLKDIGKPITLKLYYSRTAAMKAPEWIRRWNNYFLYVRSLLEEYASQSKGKLKLEVIDPRPYTDAEEDANHAKIMRFPLNQDEGFFFGLVATNELDVQKIIPYFEPDRQRFVEYDITKLISDLLHPDKKVVGYISSMPMEMDIEEAVRSMSSRGMPRQMIPMLRFQLRGQFLARWGFLDALSGKYDVRKARITGDGKIQGAIDILLLIHPKGLDAKALFAIDQFVMDGGKLVVFIDPFCRADTPPRSSAMQPVDDSYNPFSDLNALLVKWGVRTKWTTAERKNYEGKAETVTFQHVAVDRTLAVQVPVDEHGHIQRSSHAGGEVRYVRYLPFLSLNPACMSDASPISADIRQVVNVRFPGVLYETGAEGVHVQPLVTTTRYGTVWRPTSRAEAENKRPEDIRKAVIDGKEPVTIACLLTGDFQTNFPKGLEVQMGPAETHAGPDTRPTSRQVQSRTKTLPARRTAKQGATVMVFADVDIISNHLAYQGFYDPNIPGRFHTRGVKGDNHRLLDKGLEFLAASEDLRSLLGRGSFTRPFEVVKAIEAETQEETQEQIREIDEKNQRITEERRQLKEGDRPKDPRTPEQLAYEIRGGQGWIRRAEEHLAKQGEAMPPEAREAWAADIKKARDELKVLEKALVAAKAYAARDERIDFETDRELLREFEENQRKKRRLQNARLEKVEALESKLKLLNVAVAPAVILLIAVALASLRYIREKRYAARRAD